ncbi:MAG: hypothetical protein ACK47B_08725 [Armatimonadota bacterium]
MDGKESGVVLVVDDDTQAAHVLAHWLRESGFRAVAAPSPAEAGLLLRDGSRPAVILLEERLLRERRLDPAGDPLARQTPVILLTSGPSTPQLLNDGFSSYFRKDGNLGLLLEIIAAYCSRGRDM